MTGITPIKDLRDYLEPEEVDRLMDVASNCRDKLLYMRYNGTREEWPNVDDLEY